MDATALVLNMRVATRLKKRPRPRRIVPVVKEPIPTPVALLMDRIHPLWTLGAAILISMAIHLAIETIIFHPGRNISNIKPRSAPLQVAIIAKPKPPPPSKPKKPKPKQVVEPKQIQRPAPAKPFFVAGLTLSSKSSVRVKPTTEPVNNVARNYTAEKFVPIYKVSTDPVYLQNLTKELIKQYYPEEARKGEYEGMVELELTIDYDGTVTYVKVLDDPGYGFGDAAIKLAYLFRYQPALENGIPVATIIRRTVLFEF